MASSDKTRIATCGQSEGNLQFPVPAAAFARDAAAPQNHGVVEQRPTARQWFARCLQGRDKFSEKLRVMVVQIGAQLGGIAANRMGVKGRDR